MFRYEEVLINLAEPPEWFLKKNPVGEVPVLEWIDPATKEVRIVPESLIVSDYLDALYPSNRLQPADPYVKAKQQVLVGRFGSVNKIFFFISIILTFVLFRFNPLSMKFFEEKPKLVLKI